MILFQHSLKEVRMRKRFNSSVQFLSAKLFLILILITALVKTTDAQSITNYAFSASSGTYTALVGGTSPVVTGTVDEGAYNSIPIGFTFTYMGNQYTTLSACTNGYMVLGATITSPLYGNLLATGAVRPIIAPLWDDLQITSFSYLTQGTPGSRTFTAQWQGAIWQYTGTAAAVSFQAIIYEATGQVQFVYHQETGALSTASASIGITGTGSGSGNYLSLNGAGVSPTVSSTTETTTISAKPAEGQIYSFTPYSPTPADPTSMSFTAVGVTGMTVNWVDNSTCETYFTVKRATDAGFTANVVTTSVASTSILTTGAAYNLIATGLNPATMYYYKITAGNESSPSSAGITGSQITTAPGNITSNGTGGGNWSSTGTWNGGVLPTSGDNVTILDGDIITIDASEPALSVTIGQGTSGVLQYNTTSACTLTVGMDVTVSANATLTTGATGTVTTHVLSLGGNLTNNGTLDFSTNSNTAGAGITFTGSNNSLFSGGGATDIYLLTMSKSARSVIAEINLTNFTEKGLSTAAAGAILTSGVGTGTLKISGTNTFSGTVWTTAAYSIPATLGFWLNNPNFTVTALTGSPTVSGLFRVTAGTFNIGTASGNSMGFNASSVITVEGGTINAAGRFGVAVAGNAFSYTQTGGTITVTTVGNTTSSLAGFDLGTSSASAVNITGGTVIVQLASTATTKMDFRDQAGTGITGVSGATLQLGNASSGTAKAFNIVGVIPNLVITNTSANHTATMGTPVTYNNISLNITINTGNTLNLGNNVFLFDGNTIINNGTLTHTGASSRFITFSPMTNISYSGTGTVTAPMTSLELQNDLNFTIDPASSNIAVARIIIFNGNFVNSNKITLGNGAATSGSIQIGNTTTPSTGGTFDVPLTFNLGTGGQSISYLRTVQPIAAGNEINPTRILTAMTASDSTALITLSGGDLQVTTTLTLTTGSFNLGGNTLTLGTSAPTLGTLTMATPTQFFGLYNGKFKRWITAATGSLDFPIGTTITSPAASYDGPVANNISGVSPAILTVNSLKSEKEATDNSSVGTVPGEQNTIQVNRLNTSADNVLSVTQVRRLANVNFTIAPTTAGTLIATWVNTPGGSNGLPLTEGLLTVNQTSNDGYWTLTAGDGLTGGTFTGTFTGTSIAGIMDYTQLVLSNRADNSSPWLLNGVHVTTTGSNSAPVLSRTGLTTFGDFTVSGGETALPVELTSFTSALNGRDVVLNWKSKTELNLSKFVIERSVSEKSVWNVIGEVKAVGNSNSEKAYSFADKRISSGKFDYRLRIVNSDGSTYVYKNTVETTIGMPKEYTLNQNYPNPFNPSTKIEYSLPYDSHVTLELYSVTGERIAQVVNEMQKAGYYSKEVNLTKLNLASGVYMYRISAVGTSQNANFVNVKKMVMLK